MLSKFTFDRLLKICQQPHKRNEQHIMDDMLYSNLFDWFTEYCTQNEIDIVIAYYLGDYHILTLENDFSEFKQLNDIFEKENILDPISMFFFDQNAFFIPVNSKKTHNITEFGTLSILDRLTFLEFNAERNNLNVTRLIALLKDLFHIYQYDTKSN